MTDGPTILQIIPDLDTGGAERSAVEIAAAIVTAGGRALVASRGGRLASGLAAAGGELIPFPAATKNPLNILRNATRLSRLIKSENVVLIHARSRAPAWSALMAARQTRIPFVTTYHGAYGETGPLKRLYNSVMARSDIVIANSNYTADLIRQRYATPSARIRVIHRGLDASFDPALLTDARRQAIRARWGVASDARIVLQAARLTGWKGQPVLIAAAAQLHRAGRLPDDVVLVLAGSAQGRDAYATELRRSIADAGLEKRALLVGHEDDIPAAFGEAHVSVVASTEPEAFGRSAAESQAMCCPVIATRQGAPPETVLAAPEHPGAAATGWLITPASAADLADALAQALAMPDDARIEMGHRARRHVMARFTLGAMQRATLAVYDELLGTRLSAVPALDNLADHA